MRCPECGVEVNEQTARCHSCGALLRQPETSRKSRYDGVKETTKRGMPFVFLVGYLLLLLIITYPLYVVFDNRQKSERLKDNLDSIMENLKEFADQHGTFPQNPELLIDDGFMVNFPENPFHKRPMKSRTPGQAFAGDFTYLPLYSEQGKVWGCVLIGYGPNLFSFGADAKGGQDIFTEGRDYLHLSTFSSDPDGHPDGVIHILTAQRGDYQV